MKARELPEVQISNFVEVKQVKNNFLDRSY